MNKTYILIKELIESWKYKVVEDDGEQIIIRYQMNTIHFCPNSGDETFVSVILPNFDDVNEDNYSKVVMPEDERVRSNTYTIDDVIIAASEFFYMEKEDLEFQMKLSLKNLIEAKVSYRNFDK